MSSIKPFLFGSLLGAGTMFVALQYHVVQSHEGFRVVPRTPQSALGLAYADVRHWDAAHWADRPELARALVAHGSTDLIAKSVASSVVESVSSEKSTLDQLRGFLNDTKTESQQESLFSIPIPSQTAEPSKSNLDDLFTIPFQQDARKPLMPGTATQPLPTTTTQRGIPPLSDVFGRRSEVALSEPMDSGNPTTSPLPSNGQSSATSTSLTPAQETKMLEEMFFGESSTPSTATTSTRQPKAPASANSSAANSTPGGLFEDLSAKFQSRAEQAVQQMRSNAQQQTSQMLGESIDSAGRYVRDRATQSLPDSVAPIFSDAMNAAGKASTDAGLPDAQKAIRAGFDPFVE